MLINCTYPDALSIALSGMDARLLTNYLFTNNAAGFTTDQMVAVSGAKNARAWYDLALQMPRGPPKLPHLWPPKLPHPDRAALTG